MIKIRIAIVMLVTPLVQAVETILKRIMIPIILLMMLVTILVQGMMSTQVGRVRSTEHMIFEPHSEVYTHTLNIFIFLLLLILF